MALAVPSLSAADGPPVIAKPNVSAPVTITDIGANWTMDNGITKVTIIKNTSVISSLVYHGVTILGPSENWERVPSGQVTQSLTIDPSKNGGQRGEVAIKGVDGRMDIEVRYTMERGVSGFYTYAEYTHKANYPAASFGENRFILMNMNNTFDWLSVDADRNMLMCSNEDTRSAVVIHAKEQSILSTGIYKNSVEHKYTYCGIMYRLPAYGWSSTKDHIGVYFINPTTEYIGGGAEKMDLVCHMRATILDYWTSGHYAGGAGCNIPAGEEWKKVVGPIFVYFNALENPKDATKPSWTRWRPRRAIPPCRQPGMTMPSPFGTMRWPKQKRSRPPGPTTGSAAWTIPHKNERGNVTGQFVLNDPQAATTKLPGLTVGLAHPDYTTTAGGFTQRSGNGNVIKWPHDGNYYQFWANGAEDGKFTISNVRPGTYTLHAFADGVLGEYTNYNITVEAGKPLDLGKLDWKPVRYGKQVWDIGYPNRNGSEFFKGNDYWLWGWCVRYPLLFPNDITYTIGKSDYHKDWFFEQVPHGESTAWLNPEAKDPANQRFGWVKAGTAGQDMWRTIGRGRATTWTIKFNMDKAVQGQATLRIALGGADGGGLAIGVNGKPVGSIRPVSTNALRYNTDRGVWHEYSQAFDAALLKAGENEMTLTVPAGELTSGVCYDYLRLELNEN